MKKLLLGVGTILMVSSNAFAAPNSYMERCEENVKVNYGKKIEENENVLKQFKTKLDGLTQGMSSTQSCVSALTNVGLNGSFSLPFDAMINQVNNMIDQKVASACQAVYDQTIANVNNVTGKLGSSFNFLGQNYFTGVNIGRGSGGDISLSGSDIFRGESGTSVIKKANSIFK